MSVVISDPGLNPSTIVYNQVTTPGAGATIATTGPMPSGLYEMRVWAAIGGTTALADLDNMTLEVQGVGGGAVSGLIVHSAANVAFEGFIFPRVYLFAGTTAVRVRTNGAGTAGAIYRAIIILTPITRGG